MISPARSDILLDIAFNTSTGGSIVIKPDEIIYLPSLYKYVKYISNEKAKTLISTNITPSKYFKDKFNLSIEYKIQFNLEFFDKNHNPIAFYVMQDENPTPSYSLQAYTTYRKCISISPHNSNNIIVNYDSDTDDCYCSNFPKYYIKAVPSLLKISLLPIDKLLFNEYINKNRSFLDRNGIYVICPTLKLITSVATYKKALIEFD
jgi:hypothetical protein